MTVDKAVTRTTASFIEKRYLCSILLQLAGTINTSSCSYRPVCFVTHNHRPLLGGLLPELLPSGA